LIAVVIAVRLFGADPQPGVAVSLGLNYLLLGMAAFLSFGPGTRSLSWFCSIASFRWALAFLFFTGSSLLWTVSASISAAAAFWCAMACDFSIVILLLRIGFIDETVESVMSGYIWGACAIALIAWVLPSQSDLRLGDEDYLGPNQIGYACAFAFFLAQYLMRKGSRGLRLPAAFLAITLLRSLSKTTILAFIAAQFLLLLCDRSLTTRAKLYISGVTGVVVTMFWGLLASYYDVYTHAGNQSETLTGRLGIWAYILNEALQKPWIGHGFHSVWKVIPPFGSFEARHAHNEILQQFYSYGAVGVALLITIYGSVYLQIRRMTSGPIRTLLLAFLLFVLIRGLADTEVFDLSLPLWAIVLIGSAMANEQKGTELGT
jgi:O-antigen ligase